MKMLVSGVFEREDVTAEYCRFSFRGGTKVGTVDFLADPYEISPNFQARRQRGHGSGRAGVPAVRHPSE